MQRCVDDRCSDEWLTVRWCRSSGSEPDRARERPSPWLPTRGTVLLEGGEDPARHGSIGKGSWATQAGDLGVKATFDHSSQWSRRLRSAVRVRHPVWLVRTNDQRTRRSRANEKARYVQAQIRGTGQRRGTGPAACPKICGRQRAGMQTRIRDSVTRTGPAESAPG